MAASDIRQLQDTLTRHQIYLEGVKVWFALRFTRVLQELSIDLRKLFGRIQFATLDELTKRQLNDFVKQLREIQNQHYNQFVIQLLDDLESFMSVNLDVVKSIYSFSVLSPLEKDGNTVELLEQFDDALNEAGDEDNGIYAAGITSGSDKSNGRLWSVVRNEIIPASGLRPPSFVDAFVASAIGTATLATLRGYANRATPFATLASIVGTVSKNFRDGAFARVNAQGAAVGDTLIQHADSIVQAAVASLFYDRYRWISVIDSSTTVICRERNNKIYEYGSGPLPPAHIRCRSKIAPYRQGSEAMPKSFAAWFKTQPEDVQDDIGEDMEVDAISPSQFRAKLGLMLSPSNA